ncbi:MAG: MFS transporter [Pseudomonadota bacterium]
MTDQTASPAAAAPARPQSLYSYYVVVLLTVAYCFNFIDRQIIGIVSQDLKEDLQLADWQLGLLKGFAFALLYTLAGIPIARWADRSNRVRIVSIAVATWSAFTVLCGYAQNFTQLLLARIGVGIGEAGGTPPSHSIISDYFSKEQRASALGIYSLGIPFGMMFAFIAGGWLTAEFGWRGALIGVGAPGVVLALLIYLTVREPERGAADGPALAKADGGETMSVWQAAKHLFSIPTYAWACAGITAASFTAYAFASWIVPFYLRAHVGSPETLGLDAFKAEFTTLMVILGLISGGAYGLGTFLGGYLTEQAARRDRANYMRIPAIAMLLTLPAGAVQLFAGDYTTSLIFAAVTQILLGMYLAPTFALVQTLAPLHIRALSTAIFFFVLNLIALGVGPSFVGVASDLFAAQDGDPEGLRWALATAGIGIALSVVFYWMAAAHTQADWRRATGDD